MPRDVAPDVPFAGEPADPLAPHAGKGPLRHFRLPRTTADLIAPSPDAVAAPAPGIATPPPPAAPMATPFDFLDGAPPRSGE